MQSSKSVKVSSERQEITGFVSTLGPSPILMTMKRFSTPICGAACPVEAILVAEALECGDEGGLISGERCVFLRTDLLADLPQ